MISLATVLKPASESLQSHLKQVSPYRTGRLRKSIKTFVGNNKINIQMLEYGPRLDKYSPRHIGWMDVPLKRTISEVADALAENITKTL